MPISAVDTITLAFQHTKRQLIQPFRFGQWTRLALVGLLAGEMGSGGGNFNFPSNLNLPQQPGSTRHFLDSPFGSIDPSLYVGLIVVIVAAALVFGLIFMYIGSVMRFILFDSVLAKECHIRQGWSRRQGQGWSYFLFQLVFALATIAGLVILLGIPAGFAYALGWFRDPHQHVVALVLGGILVFFLLAGFFIVAAVVHVLIKDFVVPQMALEGVGVMEGWRRLWPMLQNEKGGYAGYIGMKIVLAIGAGIVVAIASVIIVLIFAIPAAALVIGAIVAGHGAGLTWNAYTITVAVVVGCIVFVIIMYLLALISVPAIVFFPAYSIYFFAPRYRTLSLVLYPPPPPTAVPSDVPPETPPPLTPAPAV